MNNKGIVFDFNELILDTESPELESWESIHQEYGILFPIKEYIKNIGPVFNDNAPIQYLIEKLGGVLDRLKEATSFGLRIGLASS